MDCKLLDNALLIEKTHQGNLGDPALVLSLPSDLRTHFCRASLDW